ncbi:hypothetical protein BCR37DRAFT_413051 [Protomyces lactucae-debilis]|uniref:Uncharacterized protein n=1 Tax=Protomyces lactucae-debilis TaxID=2754530 RepID=A0A1Y2FIN8_PROLT|nr:uncharacterized protein BCR37DRAFT_413051 [Protomyces lactucae-debilis]ORY83793.1 hypothetical protein BCR37DRAFT_413051 [Protomyces lactucae-debilis]
MAPRTRPIELRHNKRLAEADAEQQGTDDGNDMHTRQARRNARNIAPRHEQEDDSQARQVLCNTRNTAPHNEQDDESDAEALKPPRTGKRNRPLTAKAQLLQAAANDRNDRAAAASEVKQARERSKRARHFAR